LNIEKTEEIKAYLARSDEALRAARSLKKEGCLREVASRAYYSMFYAATADSSPLMYIGASTLGLSLNLVVTS